jgi:hypothetical protein
MSTENVEHLRQNKFAPGTPPAGWPKGVRQISMEGLSLLGLDEKGRLYFDGAEIQYAGLSLTRWQKIGGFLVVIGSGVVPILYWCGLSSLGAVVELFGAP